MISPNRTPFESFPPASNQRLSLHLCFSETRERFWKPLRLSSYPVELYFPFSGRLNTVTEVNGFHESKMQIPQQWNGSVKIRLDFRRLPGPVFDPRVRAHFPEQRLVIEPMLKSTLTVVVLTLSGSSRDIHQTQTSSSVIHVPLLQHIYVKQHVLWEPYDQH